MISRAADVARVQSQGNPADASPAVGRPTETGVSNEAGKAVEGTQVGAGREEVASVPQSGTLLRNAATEAELAGQTEAVPRPVQAGAVGDAGAVRGEDIQGVQSGTGSAATQFTKGGVATKNAYTEGRRQVLGRQCPRKLA